MIFFPFKSKYIFGHLLKSRLKKNMDEPQNQETSIQDDKQDVL